MSARHRVTVRRGQAHPVEQWLGHQFKCSCGESGPVRESRSLAGWDRDQHIESLPPVPAGATCQMPKQHRVPAWEACGLCAGQLNLFEVAGGGA